MQMQCIGLGAGLYLVIYWQFLQYIFLKTSFFLRFLVVASSLLTLLLLHLLFLIVGPIMTESYLSTSPLIFWKNRINFLSLEFFDGIHFSLEFFIYPDQQLPQFYFCVVHTSYIHLLLLMFHTNLHLFYICSLKLI